VDAGNFPGSVRTGSCTGSGWGYFKGMFFLTKREQIVIVAIMVCFVAGAATRHFRSEARFPSSGLPAHAPRS